ncbi:hypothetical protein [Solibacillus sp. CAU 1738]|uniref:hypothetical protein n=1 Tax=Solibacillus sp. CAU 1738 TaxID=3140363 RepID=UPI003260E608
MGNINLRALMDSNKKFEKVWESIDRNHRILYFQLDKDDEGIPAHFHPNGEDSAIILHGELTYDISFDHQIKAIEHDIVFGWTNDVHGYHNKSQGPVHILVFATPEQNPSLYEQNQIYTHKDKKVRKAKLNQYFKEISSSRMNFSVGRIEKYKPNILIYYWNTKELIEVRPSNHFPLPNQDCLIIYFK